MKAICEAHPDTEILYSKLRELAVGDTITYEELSVAIGRDVQGDARGLLNTARKWIRVRDGRVLGCVRAVGLKRLSDAETIAAAPGAIEHMRRTARREAHKLATVDYEALSPAEQCAHNTHLSTFGAFRLMTTTKARRQIAEAVAEVQHRLPFKAFLAAFNRKPEV